MLILLLAFTSPLQSSDFITFQRLSALKIQKHKAEAGRVSMHHCKHFWRAELWKQRQSVWKIKENFLPSEAGRAEEEMCLSRSLEPSLFFNFTAKQVQLRKLFSRLYIIALCPRHHWCNIKEGRRKVTRSWKSMWHTPPGPLNATRKQAPHSANGFVSYLKEQGSSHVPSLLGTTLTKPPERSDSLSWSKDVTGHLTTQGHGWCDAEQLHR